MARDACAISAVTSRMQQNGVSDSSFPSGGRLLAFGHNGKLYIVSVNPYYEHIFKNMREQPSRISDPAFCKS